jgi:hypothetical protein
MPRCAKIIATYFGNRRRPPCNAAEALKMHQIHWDLEQSVDPGIPMDTFYVCNLVGDDDIADSPTDVQHGHDFLNSINGAKTPQGKCTVWFRQNIGISFGAYNYAYQRLHDRYDYFCFIEDDHVMVKPDYFRIAVEQLEQNEKTGFISFVRIWPSKHGRPTCCGGGIGVTRVEILDKVNEQRGSLPYCKDQFVVETKASYYAHKEEGEYEFTNAIYRLGYELAYLDAVRCTCCWGADTKIKSKLMVRHPHFRRDRPRRRKRLKR